MDNWLSRQLESAEHMARAWPAWRRIDACPGSAELWLDAKAVHKELQRAAQETGYTVAWEVHSSLADRAAGVIADTFASMPGIDLRVRRIDLKCGITVFLLEDVPLTVDILEDSFDLYIEQTAHLMAPMAEAALKDFREGRCKKLP